MNTNMNFYMILNSNNNKYRYVYCFKLIFKWKLQTHEWQNVVTVPT